MGVGDATLAERSAIAKRVTGILRLAAPSLAMDRSSVRECVSIPGGLTSAIAPLAGVRPGATVTPCLGYLAGDSKDSVGRLSGGASERR